MKFQKGGEPRGNRLVKATDVFEAREESEAAWDQRDVAKAVEFLDDWAKHPDAVGFLVASLDMIAPGTVQPEQRAAIVEYYLNSIELVLAQTDSRGVSFLLVGDIENLLLVDPSAQARIPQLDLVRKHFVNHVEDFGSLDFFSETSSAPQLISFVLMEPDTYKLSDSAWQELMDKGEGSWKAGVGFSSSLQLLGLARILSPELFSAHPPAEEMRQSVLSQSRKSRPSDGSLGGFSGDLFYALILAAEEVSVTKEHGLKVRLPAAKVQGASKLPERNTV